MFGWNILLETETNQTYYAYDSIKYDTDKFTLSSTSDTLVTKENYLDYSGVDLDVELTARSVNDYGDSPIYRFIGAIENWCNNYLLDNYAFDGLIQAGNQYKRFKKGVILQIEHILTYGNLSVAEKFVETGQIITLAELNRVKMSEAALREFRMGGLANIRRG